MKCYYSMLSPWRSIRQASFLTDRVAVVTGGGAGIGRGIAAGLTAFGAKVAIWERDPESCASAAEEIGALGIPTDVRDSASVDAALAQTVAELGPVTILVNNAGGVFWSGILDTTENGWDALYKSNLRHVYLCTQRVARGLVEQTTGGQHHQRHLDRRCPRRTGFRNLCGGQGRGHQLHQDGGARTRAASHSGQRAGPGHHPDRGDQKRRTPGVRRTVRPRRYRWGEPVMSTRWPAPQYFSPPTCPATSPDRRFTSTAERTPPAAGTTTRRPAAYVLGPSS